jgi:uncharacterized protein (AIM24 family)
MYKKTERKIKMSFEVKNFFDNDDIVCAERKGVFAVMEYKRDLSVFPDTAAAAYFCSEMNVRKRLLACRLRNQKVTIQAGAMQWMLGILQASTGVKGVGDLFSKAIKSKASGESAIKPEYFGDGILVLEPTYKYLLLEDLSDWGGSVVLDDGLFLASESTVNHKIVARSNVSSALLGREGLFNLCLNGQGIVALESNVPREELIEINLDNDVIKIDGNMAIAWSSTLNFTVERTTKTLIGSAASGEGLVNVYRGTGKILMAPVGRFITSAPPTNRA